MKNTLIQNTRLVRYGTLSAICAVLPLALLSGCGGGANNSKPTTEASRAQGKVSMTIKWPQPSGTRVIPQSTKSITVTITGARGTQTQTVTKTADGTPSTITFTGLALGSYTATATAFATTDGTGTAVATANTVLNITLTALSPTLTLDLANTLSTLSLTSSLTITPPPVGSPEGTPGTIQLYTAGSATNTATITLTGFDASGAIVSLSPSTVTITPQGIASLTQNADGTYTVTGLAPGTATITATDPETGKTTSLLVVVTRLASTVFTQVLNTAFRSGAVIDTDNSRVYLAANGRFLGFTTSGPNGTGFPTTQNYNTVLPVLPTLTLNPTTALVSRPALAQTNNPRSDYRFAFMSSNNTGVYIVNTQTGNSAVPSTQFPLLSPNNPLGVPGDPLGIEGAFTEAVGSQGNRVSAAPIVYTEPDTTRVDGYRMIAFVPTVNGALGRVVVRVIPRIAGGAASVVIESGNFYQAGGAGLFTTTPEFDFGPDGTDRYTGNTYKRPIAVYTVSSNGGGQSARLYGFSTATSPTNPAGGAPLFNPVTLDGTLASGIAVGKSNLYVATSLTFSEQAVLTILDKTTGAESARVTLPNTTYVSGAPVLSADGGTVYIATFGEGVSGVGGQVFALDAGSGAIKWKFVAPFRDGYQFSDFDSTVAVGSDGRIYAGSTNGRIYSLNPADGTESFEGDLIGEIHMNPAISTDNTIYVGSDAGSFSAFR